MSGIADAALRPHEPLRHRRRSHGERAATRSASNAEHGLQHEGRADAGVDRRVRAGEQQLEPLVGDRIRIRSTSADSPAAAPSSLVRGRQRRRCPCRRAQHVALPVARHGDQPPFGVVGDAGIGPRAQRPLEGVGEGVLGQRDVARRRRPGWRAAGRTMRGRRARRPRRTSSGEGHRHAGVQAPSTNRVADGRISTAPHFTDGRRLLRPADRRIEVVHVDHERAAELLLGVGERAVLDAGAPSSCARSSSRMTAEAPRPRSARRPRRAPSRSRRIRALASSTASGRRGRGRPESSRGSGAGVVTHGCPFGSVRY